MKIKIDFKTPVGRIVLYMLSGIILLVLIWIALRQTPDEIVIENKIKQAVFREKLFDLNAKLTEAEGAKGKLLTEIDRLQKNEVPVQGPGEVQTVVINQVEYVPKIKYITLYNNYTLFKGISGKYAAFALLDVTAKQNNEEIKKEYEKRIGEMQETIDKLYRRTRGLHISIGPQAGVSLTAPYFGFGVTLGWIVK